MRYFLVKDPKTNKIYFIEASHLHKAGQYLQKQLGEDINPLNDLEWLYHEETPLDAMGRLGVYKTNEYWVRNFAMGTNPVLDITNLLRG